MLSCWIFNTRRCCVSFSAKFSGTVNVTGTIGNVGSSPLSLSLTIVNIILYVARLRQELWLKVTRGFIPRKIQWHIHTGLWSLVNWVVCNDYETLHKGLMNINEVACRPWRWHRPWWWLVYARYPATVLSILLTPLKILTPALISKKKWAPSDKLYVCGYFVKFGG